MDRDGKGKVANYYNALSQSYDELYGEEQGRKNRLVGDLLKARRFRRALDIGCGTGAFLQAYPHYHEAVGIDLSREMLRKAREKKIRNVELIVGDASSLPIRDGIADLVISISLAEARSALPRMLGELERVAEKQSTLALSIFNQQGDSLDSSSLMIQSTTKVSKRENLYLIQLNPRGKKRTFAKACGCTLRTRRDPLFQTRMPGCSHQWRGRGQMARCIRCGKLKTEFRKEQHNQKMMQREGAELNQE